MAFQKKTSWESANIKTYILPLYIIASALFILFSFYSGLKNVVYTSGINLGIEQGYTQAINELAQAASTCNAIPVSLGDQSFEVINVQCLSQQNNSSTGSVQ